jgi:hypothetical protein
MKLIKIHNAKNNHERWLTPNRKVILAHGDFAIANDLVINQECWDMDGAYLGIVIEIENYEGDIT